MQSYYILQTFAIQFIQILIILIYALAYYPVMPENQIAKKTFSAISPPYRL